MTTEVAPPLAAGRLKLREILGEGGVGTVYLAYDERLDVERAVKVLSRDRASNQIQRQRFLTEARIQARLRHPNIVEVYDIEDDGNQVYLVMELVDGGSLWDRLKAEGPMPPDEAARVAAGILAALELAHELDIVHRDIKPHNILMTERGVGKLADFGVAHLPSEEHAGVTRTGVVMGTWSFMAPEQRASSRRVDPRSDVYAVAATLYTLVTGYTEPDLFDFELDSTIMARLPEPLRPVIHHATRYSRSQRYQDARSMREDLERSLPALEGSQAAPWPVASPTDAPDAAHHVARGRQGPVATTQDRPGSADSDREARSGTLVPTPAEVERLLATPSARASAATYSDDGHTVELQPMSGARPELDTAEGKVELPIGESPDRARPAGAEGIGWTIDDERQLTEEVEDHDAVGHIEDDDEPIHATWRSAGRLRFLVFLLVLALGSAATVAYQQGWIILPREVSEIFPSLAPADPAAPDLPASPEPSAEPEATQVPAPGTPPPTTPEPSATTSPEPEPEQVTEPEPTTEPEPEQVTEPEPTTEPEPEQVTEPEPTTEPEPEPTTEPGVAPELVPDPRFPELPPGTHSDDVHRRIKMINEQDLFDCYHEALQTNAHLEGPLEVRWGIHEGAIFSPAVKATPSGHRDIGTCATDAIRGWSYPAWFTDLPRFHTWNLTVIDQAERMLMAKRPELTSCSDPLSAEDLDAHGEGALALELREGWVNAVEIKEGFGHPELDACLLNTSRAWRLPAYASGQFTMWLTFGY